MADANPDRVPLGTYIGVGMVASGAELSFTLRLMEKRLFWLDYKSQTPIETVSWHSEGTFTTPGTGDDQVVRCEIGGLPGQKRVGEIWEFKVEQGVAGAKVLVCEGVKCQPQSDTRGERQNCTKCGLEIAGQLAHHGGQYFHPDCFTCDNCNAPLSGPFKKQEDGRRFCLDCVPKTYCEGCHKVITGAATVVSDKKYHPECFRCGVCSEKLAGKFFRKGEQLLCENCVGAAPTSPTAAPAPTSPTAAPAPTSPTAAPAPPAAAAPESSSDGDAEKAADGKAEADKAAAAEAEAEKLAAAQAEAEKAAAAAAQAEAEKAAAAKAEAEKAAGAAAQAEAEKAAAAKAEAEKAEAEKAAAAKAAAEKAEAEKAAAAKAAAEKAEAEKAASSPASAAVPSGPPTFTLSLEELRNADVWKERQVDAARREEYLTNDAFAAAFGMTKAEFAAMPKWKRDAKKKELGLF